MKNSDRIRNVAIVLALGTVLAGLRIGLAADTEDQQHWSLRKVRPVSPPHVWNPRLADSPIDVFILASLESQGLSLSPQSDRRTLIRRVTFDLTGLPPTPAEIEAFVEDESPTAFADVVDRLLASAHYGERWGRHWLDVVRYADARDLIQLPAASDFREAWRYRDWVVASFNRDFPYDRFVMQQVAGDLMQPTDASQIDTDALVATGMLAIADFVPGDVDKQQMIADYVNDQIDVVGRAILGMTLACARCHDHKFDPITTEDYYSLAGIFFSTKLIPSPVKGNTPLVRVPLLPAAEIAALEERQKQDANRIVELSREIGTSGDRQYRLSLTDQVASETRRYLLAAWDCWQKSADPATVDEYATKSGLSGVTLARWIEYVDQKPVLTVLAAIRAETNREDAERKIRDLTERLSEVAEARRRLLTNDVVGKTLDETLILRFRADDQRLSLNDADRIASIPNRGPFAENATLVAEVMPPKRVTTTVGERSQSVIRFSGNELLQVPRAIPNVGSLIVAFRPDPAGGGGQRLIGWEDASVGQHGLGIMTDGAGAIHVIARRDGANGDVVVAAPESMSNPSGFQIVCINWGQDGVTVFRNGQLVGSNKAIDGLSSDPAIKSLRLGGPGSGSSSRFQGDLAELRLYDAPLDDPARKRVESELAAHWIEHTEGIVALNPIEDLYGELLTGLSPFRLDVAEREKSLSEGSSTRLTELRNELEMLKKKPKPEIPQAVVVQEGGPAETPHAGFNDAHVYIRGNHANLGPRVPRGFPVAIAGGERETIREGSGRRELALWLASPTNPLTARVIVNRIWQHHFGVGLVATSANFGAMGESPSHPKLLDFLAARLIESGWSIKALHRTIVLSNTYQQSSVANERGLAIDPENRLLWRANRRRLEAEAFRDSLLSVAGRLDGAIGGPGFQDIATARRSLYLMSVRTGAKSSEFGPLFDAPDCSGIVERRTESIVAPQALFFMNDPLVARLSVAIGERITQHAKDGKNRDRIRDLYELALGRVPTDAEYEIGSRFLGDGQDADAWFGYCRLIVSTNEFLFVD